MVGIVEERVMNAMERPIIYLCASGNPKSERMAYINWIRLNGLRNTMTVLYRQMSNRVIVGPKDFNMQCYVNDYDLITQEELDEAWEKRESKPMVPHKKEQEPTKEDLLERARIQEQKFYANNPFAALDLNVPEKKEQK